MLNMKNTKVIQLSPDKENMRYIVEKASGEIEQTFSWLLYDLNLFRGDMEKTVIFCCSIKECGEIYETFLYSKSDHEQQRHFAMYHAKTPQRIKDLVLTSFLNPDGAIRLVIATSALGMGVNIPNIRRIVNYGVPKDMYKVLGEEVEMVRM